MSKVGVIQIHNEVNRNNGRCCCICFRPFSERRVVEPECLSILISKLANIARFKSKLQVCYICEGLARSAARFVKAVELAARVNELFPDLDKPHWVDIAKCLGPNGKAERAKEPSKDILTRRALHLDRDLRSCPRYELYRTDTLVVSAAAPTSTPKSATAPVSSQQRTEMVVVMQHEDPLSTVLPVLQPVMPVVSPLVLPGLPQVPITSRLPQLSIDPDRKHMRVLNKDTNEFILHPMVKGVDGNVYVPSLQLHVMDNNILKSVDIAHLRNCLPTFTPVTNPNLKSTNLNSNNLKSTVSSTVTNINKIQMGSLDSIIDKNKDKSHYYNFLLSQVSQKKVETQNINNVQVIKMDDLNIVLNVDNTDENAIKRKRTYELEQTLKEVAHILDKKVQGSCEISYELIDDEDASNVASGNQVLAASKNVAGGNRVSPSGKRVLASGNRAVAGGNHVSASSKNAVNSAAKEPVLKTDRTVDWEDKIPMDVISFMDATDPNPEERIMQPPSMGYISDVRSVPDLPDNIECIDLC